MKKIVGIIGAAAVLASSIFAADVAGQLKLGAKLYDSESKSILTTPASSGWDDNNTYFKLSATTDIAGAEMHFSAEDATYYNYSLWFKPIDALKVTAGNVSVSSIAKGTFAWWATTAKFESSFGEGKKCDGFKFDITVDNLSFTFLSAKTALLNFSNEGYAVLGDFWLDGKFGLGDYGTIQVAATKGATINAYGVGGWETAGLAFLVAYDHMPWQQTGFYADVLVNLADAKAFEGVSSQIGGQYVADGLAIRLTNMIAFGQHYGDGENHFDYGFVAKASYAIDAFTPYIQLLGNEIMDKKCGLEVGCDTNVGACAINVAFTTTLNFNEGSTFSFAIPVYLSVGL